VTGGATAQGPLGYVPPPDVGRLEAAVSIVLRVGVSASAAVLTLGTVVTLATSHGASRAVASLRRGAAHPSGLVVPRSVSGVVHGVLHGYGPALVMLGVLLLVLTPVTRVAVSLIVYAREHDTTFVVISAVVLALLLTSFTLS
jgi:uncharacterized membrane protein